MASTTNYNWDTPDNSGLVKNGAQDMRTLGNAIDTSVWNVGFGQAGKNKIINGNFGIWQRGTTQSVIDTGAVYGSADRWLFGRNGTTGTGTNTVSRQTFTVGQTDVPNNPTFYCRWTVTTLATSQTRIDVNQYIEDVSLFAGQTVNLSFYGKSSTARTYEVYLEQNFGSGGSSAVATLIASGTITTGWTRLNVTGTLPSISGKTVGAGNYLRLILRVTGVQSGDVVEFANVQLEYGSKATNFQLAGGGDPQSEFAMCQRYYNTNTVDLRLLSGTLTNANYAIILYLPQMRSAPTFAFTSAASASNNVASPSLALLTSDGSTYSMRFTFVATAANTDTFYVRSFSASAEL